MIKISNYKIRGKNTQGFLKRISTQKFQDFLSKYGIKSKSLEDVYSEDYRAFNLLVTDNERKTQQKQFLFSRIIWNLDKVYAKCLG
ncbi:hypothetical protein L6303_02270 [archaeon]|nr:hypothetical protein [Nanoarchaeota archaeon]MBU4299767.1 hypothetical protein [Nanoarchaeota archaeon]MCG2723546.1 hypothetical protein [archaeon]